jgi:ribosomal protein S18 acetylase RimI-like enzyme
MYTFTLQSLLIKTAPLLVCTKECEAVLAAYLYPTDAHETPWFYARSAFTACARMGIGAVGAGIRAVWRYRRYYRRLKVHQQRFFSDVAKHQPYIYIYTIATAADKQRRGYARALMDHINAYADRMGYWIYLESTTLESKRFYEKAGFGVFASVAIDADAKIDGQSDVGEGKLAVTIMTRKPSSSSMIAAAAAAADTMIPQ